MNFLTILAIVVKVILALGVVWIALVILDAFASTALAHSAKRDQAENDSPAGQAAVKASWDAHRKAEAEREARKTPAQREAEWVAWRTADHKYSPHPFK
jgi:hypothetical protein